jgi:ketosteroid isomerase-like protein
MDEAADAYIRGDLRRYLALFDHGDDYTLMPPYGGPTVRGYEPTEEGIETTSQFFSGPGTAAWETEATYAAGDLAVLVGVERQHGVVDGRPEQDWSLRLTLVFRRVGERWQLVHRHADPLVRAIPFDHLAELARGLDD